MIVFNAKSINCEVRSMVVGVFYRYGNTLRFPRVTREPPCPGKGYARARRLKPCPRKATIRSGKQPSAYFAFYFTTRITTTLYGGTSIYAQSQNLRKAPIKLMLHTVLVT